MLNRAPNCFGYFVHKASNLLFRAFRMDVDEVVAIETNIAVAWQGPFLDFKKEFTPAL